MKTLFLSIAALLCAYAPFVESSEPNLLTQAVEKKFPTRNATLNKPFGFGAGITGGDGGSTVNVSTQAVQEPMTRKKNPGQLGYSPPPNNSPFLQPKK